MIRLYDLGKPHIDIIKAVPESFAIRLSLKLEDDCSLSTLTGGLTRLESAPATVRHHSVKYQSRFPCQPSLEADGERGQVTSFAGLMRDIKNDESSMRNCFRNKSMLCLVNSKLQGRCLNFPEEGIFDEVLNEKPGFSWGYQIIYFLETITTSPRTGQLGACLCGSETGITFLNNFPAKNPF